MTTAPHDALERLSALLAARREDELDSAMRIAERAAGATAVEEAILQSYLFLGYPVALNAMARWRALSSVPRPERAEIDRRTWMDRGEAVCALVYGGQYERLRANVRSLHPDMEHWMVEEGYGKVLGRPGLSLLERELCIVALLAVLDVPRQLYSHLRGALNLGGSEEAVDGALEVGLQYAEPAARQRARETWVAVRSRTALGG